MTARQVSLFREKVREEFVTPPRHFNSEVELTEARAKKVPRKKHVGKYFYRGPLLAERKVLLGQAH